MDKTRSKGRIIILEDDIEDNRFPKNIKELANMAKGIQISEETRKIMIHNQMEGEKRKLEDEREFEIMTALFDLDDVLRDKNRRPKCVKEFYQSNPILKDNFTLKAIRIPFQNTTTFHYWLESKKDRKIHSPTIWQLKSGKETYAKNDEVRRIFDSMHNSYSEVLSVRIETVHKWYNSLNASTIDD